MLATKPVVADRGPNVIESWQTAVPDHARGIENDDVTTTGTLRVAEQPATAATAAATVGAGLKTSTDAPAVYRSISLRQSPAANPEYRFSSTSSGSDGWSMKQARIDQEKQRMPIIPSKNKGIKSFLTLKEPSTLALQELAGAHTRATNIKAGTGTGQSNISNVSMQKLPSHVPRVNSRWDGLPDNGKRKDAEGKVRSSSKDDLRLVYSPRSKISTSSSRPEPWSSPIPVPMKRFSEQSTSRSSHSSVSPWPEPPLGYENTSAGLGGAFSEAPRSVPPMNEAQKYSTKPKTKTGENHDRDQSRSGNGLTEPLMSSAHNRNWSSSTNTPTSPSRAETDETRVPSTPIYPTSTSAEKSPRSATHASPSSSPGVINFSRPRLAQGDSPVLPSSPSSKRHENSIQHNHLEPSPSKSSRHHPAGLAINEQAEPRFSSIATPDFEIHEADDTSLTVNNGEDSADADDAKSLAPSDLSAQWHLSPRERLGLGGTLIKKGDVMPWEASDPGLTRGDMTGVGDGAASVHRHSPVSTSRSQRLGRRLGGKR